MASLLAGNHELERRVDSEAAGGVLGALTNDQLAAELRRVARGSIMRRLEDVRNLSIVAKELSPSTLAFLDRKNDAGESARQLYLRSRVVRTLARLLRVLHVGPAEALEALYASPDSLAGFIAEAQAKIRDEFTSRSAVKVIRIEREVSQYAGTLERPVNEYSVQVSTRVPAKLYFNDTDLRRVISEFGNPAALKPSAVSKPATSPRSNLVKQPGKGGFASNLRVPQG